MRNPRSIPAPAPRIPTPSLRPAPKPDGVPFEKQGFLPGERGSVGPGSRSAWFGQILPAAADLFGNLFFSPPPTISFQALLDNGSGIPPDSDGAVGPNHLMVIVNRQVGYQDKTGTLLFSESLNSFWTGVPGLTDVFDSKALYDPYSGRFIVVTLANEQSTTSMILLAVSTTSSPLGGWWLYSFPVDTLGKIWADYPSIGFSKDWIVIDTIAFTVAGDAGSGSRLWAFNKANALAGSPIGYTEFTLSNIAWTLGPAETFSSTLSTLYLVGNDTPSSGSLELYALSGAVGAETLSFVATVQGSAAWAVGPAGFADFAPQLGTTALIQNGDERMSNVVYRNGSIWATHNVFLPAAAPTRCSVQWWQISTSGAVQQLGLVDDPTGATFYAYPSIAVNADNDALIGYSSFSATQYASANYSFRYAQDPLNSLQSPRIFKAGEASYVHIDPDGGNRWGDFSHTCVDPTNDIDLWTIQEYAASPGNTWGTWWARLAVDTTPPATPGSPDLLASSDTGSNSADNLTSVTTPTFTGVVEANATVNLYAGATLVGTSTADGTGLYTVTASALAGGVYNFTVTATDSAYNTSTASAPLSVTIDATPPTTTITTPVSAASYATATSPVALGGTSADASGITLVTWVNAATGQSGVASGLTTWTASVPLTSGSNPITVISWDSAGNAGAATLTVTYTPVDTLAPVISVSPPTSSATTPIAMTGTASDNVGVVSVGWINQTTGTSGAAAGSAPWNASVPLTSGNNLVFFQATDAAGNIGVTSVTLTLTPPADLVSPTVAITAPTASSTFSTSSSPVALGGTASDNVGVSRVTWSNAATGAAGVASGTTAWSTSVALAPGANPITVKSQDPAGNVASALLTVTFTPPAGDSNHPFIAVQSPTSAGSYRTGSSSATIGGIASDDVAVTGVFWSNSLTAASGGAVGTSAWSADVPLAQGYNVVTFTALDASGNATSTTITVAYSRGGGGGGGGGGCGFLGAEAGLVLLLASGSRRRRRR
jgi:hypothetical protein